MRRLCARLKGATSRFRPSLTGLIAALIVAAVCVPLGNWQYAKAQRKMAAQALLESRGRDAVVELKGAPVDAASLDSRPVSVKGRFEPAGQFFVDNRVLHEAAGYHVLTPFHIDGSDTRVLVNRGWIPAQARHSDTPQVATPDAALEIRGIAVIPGSRFFTLGGGDTSPQPVWQNLDLARFTKLVAYPLLPVVVQLDAASPAGFAREWPRPDERFERHLSYAYQWYGFAISALLIWFAVAWKKP
jgi:surfeit locus 1 family protein